MWFSKTDASAQCAAGTLPRGRARGPHITPPAASTPTPCPPPPPPPPPPVSPGPKESGPACAHTCWSLPPGPARSGFLDFSWSCHHSWSCHPQLAAVHGAADAARGGAAGARAGAAGACQNPSCSPVAVAQRAARGVDGAGGAAAAAAGAAVSRRQHWGGGGLGARGAQAAGGCHGAMHARPPLGPAARACTARVRRLLVC